MELIGYNWFCFFAWRKIFVKYDFSTRQILTWGGECYYKSVNYPQYDIDIGLWGL